MFSKRRTSPHVYNQIEKGNIDYAFTQFYVPTPVDEFTHELVLNPDGSESITLTTDITMLFNQQRLDRCTQESLLRHFDSLAHKSSSFSSLRQSLSDQQLMSIVKSRYIQAPSELLAYSNYLVQHYGDELAALSGDQDSKKLDPDFNNANANETE